MGLYKITDSDFFIDNPQALLDPVFKEVESSLMKYVFFVTDFDSQYMRLPPRERHEQAVYAANLIERGKPSALAESLYPKPPKGVVRVIDHYKDLQGDTLIQESLDGVTQSIKELSKAMKEFSIKDVDVQELEKATKTLPLLYKLRDDLLEKTNVYKQTIAVSNTQKTHTDEQASLLDEDNLD